MSGSWSELAFTGDDAAMLLRAASEARKNAYAPYSDFRVGAALLDEEGRVHTGVNVENAVYGLTTCAERSAVVCAVGEGVRSFRAIAVAGPEGRPPALPCGSCRQILHEMSPDLLVIVKDTEGRPRVIPLHRLLPEPFGRGSLEGPPRHPPEP